MRKSFVRKLVIKYVCVVKDRIYIRESILKMNEGKNFILKALYFA